jgi:N-acyl homoserine lactone hydrolase
LRGVPIYVQRAEFEAAAVRGYTVPEWFSFPGADYRLLDGPFRLNELVETIPTPGHTPGHQSVVVSSRVGVEVIVAQAAYSAREFDCFLRNSGSVRADGWCMAAYAESLRRLHALKPVAAYFSHDGTVWSQA